MSVRTTPNTTPAMIIPRGGGGCSGGAGTRTRMSVRAMFSRYVDATLSA